MAQLDQRIASDKVSFGELSSSSAPLIFPCPQVIDLKQIMDDLRDLELVQQLNKVTAKCESTSRAAFFRSR